MSYAAYDYGNYLINGQLSYNGTASLAKIRLQGVLYEDRQRAPAYRWERVDTGGFCVTFAFGIFSAAPWLSDQAIETIRSALKPRWRLVRRT